MVGDGKSNGALRRLGIGRRPPRTVVVVSDADGHLRFRQDDSGLPGALVPPPIERLALDRNLPFTRGQGGDLLLPGGRAVAVQTARSEVGLDLPAAPAEGLDLLPRDVRQLEGAARIVAQLIADLLQLGRQLGTVDGAEVFGGFDDLVVLQGAPLPVRPPGEVHRHGMGVELRILLPAGLVPPLGDGEVAGDFGLAAACDLGARLGPLLGVLKGPRDGQVMCRNDPFVAAKESLDRHALRRREGEIDAEPLLAVVPIAGGPSIDSERDTTVQHHPEIPRIDRARQLQDLGRPALPGTGLTLLGIVVVDAVLVVARKLGTVLPGENRGGQHRAPRSTTNRLSKDMQLRSVCTAGRRNPRRESEPHQIMVDLVPLLRRDDGPQQQQGLDLDRTGSDSGRACQQLLDLIEPLQ